MDKPKANALLGLPLLLLWFWAGTMSVGLAAFLMILLYKGIVWAWML